MLRRRRFCKRCLVISAVLSLLSFYFYCKIKTPEIFIPEVCRDDRQQFVQDINVSLDCDCGRFLFRPSSYVDSLVNGFNSVGERKTILYLTLLDGRRVVLKYRKNSMRSLKLKAFYRPESGVAEQEKILNELLSGNGFNGHPHFCSTPHSKGNAYNRMSSGIEWKEDNLLVASMNFEVILLKFLKSSGLPVPDYIANCGLYLMVEYGGLTMDHFYKSSVKCRLTIARNLLLAAKALTAGHRGFRIYLTDATKDNIAVDEKTLQVTFIDLDDVIIQSHIEENGSNVASERIHKHQKMQCDNCFAFSSQDICAATQSDINIFTICQLLLEDLNGNYLKGFLYFQSVENYPKTWKNSWADFLKKLRHCVYCDNSTGHQLDRFQLVDVLVDELDSLLIYEEQ